jgi:SEC-C motif
VPNPRVQRTRPCASLRGSPLTRHLLGRLNNGLRVYIRRPFQGGASCLGSVRAKTKSAFEHSSKRRKGFPSETKVRRGERIVHGDKELIEKLGRNDLCPCDSGRRFQEVLHDNRPF